MKEKIRKILTVDRGVVYGDIPGLIADLKFLVNQEVERRIAERQLTDEDIIDFALLYVSHKSLLPANKGLIKDAIIIGMKEVRSRLTNPGVNDSQKTEGGGE